MLLWLGELKRQNPAGNSYSPDWRFNKGVMARAVAIPECASNASPRRQLPLRLAVLSRRTTPSL
jgi:hypothetical protein